MGQSHSEVEHRSKEEITAELAERFARKCFEPLELYSFKDNFKSLADHVQDVRYLKEDTVSRFLELPDILGVSPVIFQMISYIGAFPFLHDAPAVLGFEQMINVVAIMTERHARILAKGAATRRKLFFKSLAVYDRKFSEISGQPVAEYDQQRGSDGTKKLSHAPGFAVDAAGPEDPDDEGAIEDDELVLAALNSLDLQDAFKFGDAHAATTHGAMIPADNFRRLLMLLLLIAPLDVQESLSTYAPRVTGNELERLRTTAEDILTAFLNVEKSPGIKYAQFNIVIPGNLPFLFNGFNPLFEHFLFSKNLDLSKRKGSLPKAKENPISSPPLLPEEGNIMNSSVLSQLSFFIPGNELFRRLRLLYSGADAGFSMGSFETKVFNWRAPTILLVTGTRLPDANKGSGSEANFTRTLPPKRFPNGSSADRDRVTFGVLVRQPWRHSHKECFGGDDTILFQLSPTHDVFSASRVNKDYVAFTKPPAPYPGISFGCPPPKSGQSSRHETLRALGPVSLLIDSSFEYGVFTHDYTSRGGAFATSVSRKYDFQDRFQIDDIEVWGCGGDAEAKIQRDRWEWEAREAEARRRINLGTGDIAVDRALLEMAGLVGSNRSGGSMG
ncbi:TLD-domain-containing protein [Xylariales sp. PMI_506]|nr:TLD-domain-containing protein [Xylariales sp. PMI_506]